MWDGDGTICVYKNTFGKYQNCCSVVSTLHIVENIKLFVKGELDISLSICKHVNVMQAKIGGNFQTHKFLTWLYENCSRKLDRKYKKHLTIVKPVPHLKERSLMIFRISVSI